MTKMNAANLALAGFVKIEENEARFLQGELIKIGEIIAASSQKILEYSSIDPQEEMIVSEVEDQLEAMKKNNLEFQSKAKTFKGAIEKKHSELVSVLKNPKTKQSLDDLETVSVRFLEDFLANMTREKDIVVGIEDSLGRIASKLQELQDYKSEQNLRIISSALAILSDIPPFIEAMTESTLIIQSNDTLFHQVAGSV